MMELGEQIEEIKYLLSSSNGKNKAVAYPKLLLLQQQISTFDSSSIEILVDSSSSIIPLIVSDIPHNDEEIAAQALKCLGFMIYHPTIVASTEGDCNGNISDMIVKSLVQVIMTTKIKSVCNLSVWCLSIQQFSSCLLNRHCDSLIRAVVYAIDNPIGSLSTTFEALQALIKLSDSVTVVKMRDTAFLWAPPVYKRLVSSDKRERDMSERCLVKVGRLLCQPHITLSKAVAKDLKKNLISDMRKMLEKGMKIQCLKAWAWFIRLLGPCTLEKKRLVNEMLKIVEVMFSDVNSQVRIAAVVAWEGLVDALIDHRVLGESDNEDNGLLKITKLIMAPLIGLMDGKCDVTVRLSCFSGWSYLLHKLGASVGSRLVIKTVWEPVIELVFRAGPDSMNIWSFDACVDLLDMLIRGGSHNQETHESSVKSCEVGHLVFANNTMRLHSINCPPGSLRQLDFLVKMIDILVIRDSNCNVTPEVADQSSNAAVRLFRSVLDMVQKSFLCVSDTSDGVPLCLNKIFEFLGKICRCVTSTDGRSYCCPHTCLEFLQAVILILDPSILESPLYKMGLESFMKKTELGTDTSCARLPRICSLDFEDKVLPLVYLNALYISVITESSAEEPEYKILLEHMSGHVTLLLSAYDPKEVLFAFVCLLYKNTAANCIEIWLVLVRCLNTLIASKKDQSILKLERNRDSYPVVFQLLLYPFACSLLQFDFELQIVIEAWELLYASVNQASLSTNGAGDNYSEDFCEVLNRFTDQIMSALEGGKEGEPKENQWGAGFLLLHGNVIICILKQLISSRRSKWNCYTYSDSRKSNIKSSITLAAGFMKLLFVSCKGKNEQSTANLAWRFLSEMENFIRCLHEKDVLLFVEATMEPIPQWLSESHLLDKAINYQFQKLWTEILRSLQQSGPSIMFDSSFLEFLAPIFQTALDHPNASISEATIKFWNSTYGTQKTLEIPENLLPILDKLFRDGKINLCSPSHYVEVTTVLKKCSKRVRVVSNLISASDAKRKRLELTEHQKEVRRAQQGRAKDCSGHGPGIRTYTSLDFSQVNEESQESP